MTRTLPDGSVSRIDKSDGQDGSVMAGRRPKSTRRPFGKREEGGFEVGRDRSAGDEAGTRGSHGGGDATFVGLQADRVDQDDVGCGPLLPP